MATSASDPTSLGPLLGPLISAFSQQLRPLLGLLMIHTIFGAMLVPILLTLLYLSSARLRSAPLFWMVLFDVLLGIALAIWDDSVMLGVLFNLLGGVPRDTYLAFPLVQSLSTWVVDLTLLLRLLAVFPFSLTPSLKFTSIFVFPALIKTARIGLIITSITLWSYTVTSVTDPTATTSSNIDLLRSPLLIAEFFCELADHTYVSSLFLWKLYSGFSSTDVSGRVSQGSSTTVVDRIRTLFYIALGNFIFPVIFNILLLLVLFRGNKIDVIYIVPANTYVTILGVVFATVWNQASREQKSLSQGSTTLPPITFKPTGYPATSQSPAIVAPTSWRHSLTGSRGNGGSTGTINFDGFHFGRKGSGSGSVVDGGVPGSFLDITIKNAGTRDPGAVMHRV